MVSKRYYGAEAPRSTGPHPDPLSDVFSFAAEAREILQVIVDGLDAGHPPHLETYDRARKLLRQSLAQ